MQFGVAAEALERVAEEAEWKEVEEYLRSAEEGDWSEVQWLEEKWKI